MKKYFSILAAALLAAACTTTTAPTAQVEQPYGDFRDWALTPPMGWNSWDCYGAAVTEDTVRKNAEYMAEHLKENIFELTRKYCNILKIFTYPL